MTTIARPAALPIDATEATGFPGRWAGGVSMILGPLLMLTGVLLRSGYDFFYPHQLAAYAEQPTLMFASYSAFLAGNLLLWPAIVTLARSIGAVRPGLALWGGMFVLFGLFARTFHAGVDHLAFQLVDVQNLDAATKAVSGAYGAVHIVSTLSFAILAGWIVLAVGAYLSRALGLVQSVALALMAALPIGVLKGTTLLGIAAVAGLCVALVPLGVKTLRDGPKPRPASVARWSGLIVVAVAAMFMLGQAG
ncbi:hypothetical protein AB5J62_28240 [Amycolatopsis sp. cg5]|uniref:hypothetical protein n=1 Tax=Amycolatopsis sp. cg5 TaxID=3238802 RepID=UPI0035254216